MSTSLDNLVKNLNENQNGKNTQGNHLAQAVMTVNSC